MRTAFRNPLIVALVAAATAIAIYALISAIAGGFTPLYALFCAVAALLISLLFTLVFARRG